MDEWPAAIDADPHALPDDKASRLFCSQDPGESQDNEVASSTLTDVCRESAVGQAQEQQSIDLTVNSDPEEICQSSQQEPTALLAYLAWWWS